MIRVGFTGIVAAALLLVASASEAHVRPTSDGQGLTTGLMHIFAEPAQLMMLVAMALTFAAQPLRRLGVPLAGFALALGASLLLVAIRGSLDLPSLLPGLTVLAALIAAAALSLPVALHTALLIAAGFAVANDTISSALADAGAGAVVVAMPLWPLIGVWLGVSLFIAVLMFVFSRAGLLWQRIGLRILAAWLAAGALLSLALALRGLHAV